MIFLGCLACEDVFEMLERYCFVFVFQALNQNGLDFPCFELTAKITSLNKNLWENSAKNSDLFTSILTHRRRSLEKLPFAYGHHCYVTGSTASGSQETSLIGLLTHQLEWFFGLKKRTYMFLSLCRIGLVFISGVVFFWIASKRDKWKLVLQIREKTFFIDLCLYVLLKNCVVIETDSYSPPTRVMDSWR